MSWLEALILGIVQGLTEFLPVSSSGHLVIISHLFGIDAESNLTFAIAVHAATVLSTIVVFWSVILQLFQSLFKFTWNEDTQYIAKLVISMIPVGIVGVFFKDYVEDIFGSNLMLVGFCLFVTAILLTFAYYYSPRNKSTISYRDSFLIGVAQSIAVLPGLSRSGSTIATGLILGNRRGNIAQFSFLMVLVPIIGEAVLDLIKGNFAESSISSTSLIVGFLAAFISGLFACKVMINIVKKGKLIYFAIYCVAAGIFAIILSLN